MNTTTAPLSGRRAEAARNDQRILDAARAVFFDDPDAPISAVAKRAGVGISALYRRYAGKDALLQRLAADGMRRYIAEAEAALAATGDLWTVFAEFMRRALDAGAGSISLRFAGRFPASEEMQHLGRSANALTQRLLHRTAGALRPGIEVPDISLIFEQLQSIRVDDPARAAQLRHRYLALFLDGLRATAAPPLPGPAPAWEEIHRRYDT
jgi:AcrR family transcriptional regulator